MENKIISTFISGILLINLIFANVGFGQIQFTENTKNQYSNRILATELVRDISKIADNGEILPISGIEAEVDKIKTVLKAPRKNNAFVIGDFASHRELIAGNLALNLRENKTSDSLRNARVIALDLNAAFTRGADRSSAEKAILDSLQEIREFKDPTIALIDDIEVLSKTNSGISDRVSDELRKLVIDGKVRILTTGTSAQYVQVISVDPELAKLFQKIDFELNEKDLADPFVGDKISPDLRDLMGTRSPDELAEVIIQTDDSSNPHIRDILESKGVIILDIAENLGMIVAEMPIGAAENISDIKGLKHISLVRTTARLGHLETTTGIAALRSVPANAGITGRGVGIAILDSSIYEEHDAFTGTDPQSPQTVVNRVVESRQFISGGSEDKFGHGTHVAAIAAGRGGRPGDQTSIDQIGNYQGIAPDAHIVSLKVLDQNGIGRTASLISAIDWLIEKRFEYNIRVVNMSLGTPAVETWRNDPLCRAVRQLTAAGIVVVAAAGNHGRDSQSRKVYGMIHSPGNDPTVITVGATNTYGTDNRSDDRITTFSSRGPTRSYFTDNRGRRHYDHLVKPDVSAPGNKIIAAASKQNELLALDSSLLTHSFDNNKTRLMRLSGTSMATPVVAGAAALMIQANPNLTPNLVKMGLMYSAQPLAGFNHFEQGAGEVNIEGAVRLAKLIRADLSPSTPLGSPMLNSYKYDAESSIIAGEQFRWSQGMVVNNGFVAGTGLITRYQKVYEQGRFLSDGLIMTDGMLMSDGILMSEGLLMSDTILVSNGLLMSDGVPFIDWSEILGSGLLMSDGFIMSDGILLSDGLLMSDGIILSDTAFGSGMRAMLNGDSTAGMQ